MTYTPMNADELKQHFSKRLRRWMRENGMSHRALADACGMSNAAPTRWTSGESLPRAFELRCLCEATGISADELLGLDR